MQIEIRHDRLNKEIIQSNDLSLDPSYYCSLKFKEELDECGQHLPESILDHCRHYYTANANHLSYVDGPCITHRDFRPGNVIINQRNVQGVIDWAGARAGFAEEDFSSLALGEWSTQEEIKKTFLEGYSSIRTVPNYDKIMPFLQLSRAIAIVGFTLKSGTWKTSNAKLFHQNFKLLKNILKIE